MNPPPLRQPAPFVPWLAVLSLAACSPPLPSPAPAEQTDAPALPPRPTHEAARTTPSAAPSAAPIAPIDWSASPYPWLRDPAPDLPAPTDVLAQRFPAPPGFQRVDLPPSSFGAWLRGLPLAEASAPVRTFRGALLREPSHPSIAGVVALDVGNADLQQCADSILRLHAEWRWSQGDRAVSYRAASGAALPYSRWAAGERVVPDGNRLLWKLTGAPSRHHDSFRKYLAMVFTWANTGSIARDALPLSLDQLRPGDFFVLPGSPGHAVLVLDLARAPDGRRVVLLGQGFMPAQSFHILRDSEGSPWFAIRPADGSINTPFWQPFPWSSLRRLDEEHPLEKETKGK
ncbi:MAG: DUF4846 domain-containing protein [Polyangiaceae bacterium]|nr:DUF4846 domain-containing protein [Polyangiaceae bacterium]